MIRFAAPQDRPAIIELWNICFPDDSGFNEYFFSHIFSLDNVLLYEMDGRIAAMTQMLPYQLKSGGQLHNVTYIYGACTHPDYRRRHLMSELLSESFQIDRKQGRKASVLIPAEPWLFDFYAQFGYRPAFYIEDRTVTVSPIKSIDCRPLVSEDLPAASQLYEHQLQRSADAWIKRNPADFTQQISMFRALGGEVYGLFQPNQLAAFAFVWRSGAQTPFVQEIFASSDFTKQTLLQAIAAATGSTLLHIVGPVNQGSGMPLACLYSYSNTYPENGYMNLMLN